VTAVEETIIGKPGTPCWSVIMLKPDGTTHGYLFPKFTLEQRAAEYGFTDVDEILDVVLHEPYQIPTSPVEAAVHGVARHTARTLFEAASTAEAREGHRTRIARTKAERVTVHSPRQDPLDVIRHNHGITPEGVRARREPVDTYRWITLYGGLPVTIDTGSPR
jgi:hypothetical protein